MVQILSDWGIDTPDDYTAAWAAWQPTVNAFVALRGEVGTVDGAGVQQAVSEMVGSVVSLVTKSQAVLRDLQAAEQAPFGSLLPAVDIAKASSEWRRLATTAAGLPGFHR